jgi:hypothetical protein
LVFAAILLTGAGFSPEKYELSARFVGALVKGELKTAAAMMTTGAKISEWSNGKKSLSDLAEYLRRCPIKSFEGNEQMNINLLLNCPDEYHSASIQFRGNKISEVNFGPPPVVRTFTPLEKPNG